MAKLGQLSASNPSDDPGTQFHENELISCLETTQRKDLTTPTPTIHTLQTKRPFKYKKYIQCSGCKMYGHDLESEDRCRYLAQHYHTTKYMTNKPEKAKTNAEAYAKAQNRVTNKKVLATYPQLLEKSDTEEEMQDKIFRMAMIFNSEDNGTDDSS